MRRTAGKHSVKLFACACSLFVVSACLVTSFVKQHKPSLPCRGEKGSASANDSRRPLLGSTPKPGIAANPDGVPSSDPLHQSVVLGGTRSRDDLNEPRRDEKLFGWREIERVLRQEGVVLPESLEREQQQHGKAWLERLLGDTQVLRLSVGALQHVREDVAADQLEAAIWWVFLDRQDPSDLDYVYQSILRDSDSVHVRRLLCLLSSFRVIIPVCLKGGSCCCSQNANGACNLCLATESRQRRVFVKELIRLTGLINTWLTNSDRTDECIMDVPGSEPCSE